MFSSQLHSLTCSHQKFLQTVREKYINRINKQLIGEENFFRQNLTTQLICSIWITSCPSIRLFRLLVYRKKEQI